MTILISSTNDSEELLCIQEGVSAGDLIRSLNKGKMIVSFKKKTTGKYRLMFGTRNLKLIPKDKHPTSGDQSRMGPWGEPKSDSAYSIENIDGQGYYRHKDFGVLVPMFDLIKKEWRSFYVQRVKSFKKGGIHSLIKILQHKRFTDEGDKEKKIIGGTKTGIDPDKGYETDKTNPVAARQRDAQRRGEEQDDLFKRESCVPPEALRIWEAWNAPVIVSESALTIIRGKAALIGENYAVTGSKKDMKTFLETLDHKKISKASITNSDIHLMRTTCQGHVKDLGKFIVDTDNLMS